MTAALLLLAALAADPAELDCLTVAPGQTPPEKIVYQLLLAEATSALDQRQATYEALKTAEQIAAHQRALRETLIEQLGGFPQRTPLNAQVLATISADGYRLEKVLFESQPNHHVSAVLYLPDRPAPYPAVVVSSGHSRTAKAAEYNQRLGIALAKNGMAAFCFDPIGQGERSQILTGDGRPQFEATTQEHFLVGVGSILVGRNTASYRIWDAMRAIDYVASRPDIDASKIGYTGCSGGGTLTSYLMALDDRVACAAPACYLTSFRRLLETIGPQDAEQNIFGQLSRGIDHADYLLLAAPRPVLVSASTGDYFDIQGTWDSFRQAKRIYTRLGAPEKVDLVEAEGGHGVQPENLAAIVRWMKYWLTGQADAVDVREFSLLSESELQCTPAGQVLLLENERSVFSLNAEIAHSLRHKRETFWASQPLTQTLDKVRQLAGIRPLAEIPERTFKNLGRVDREEYHIDKFVLECPGAAPLPGLTYHPVNPLSDAYLYLHEDGKLGDGAPNGPIEELLRQGYVVVSVDLSGMGETAAGGRNAQLGDWKNFYMAYLVGRSLVGMRAEETLAAARFVANYQTKTPRKVHLAAVGEAAVPALHAAACERDLFASVTLKRSLDSWDAHLEKPVSPVLLSNTVHGALAHYDLPDLSRVLGDKLRSEPSP